MALYLRAAFFALLFTVAAVFTGRPASDAPRISPLKLMMSAKVKQRTNIVTLPPL
jgi:hypothetical protein